MPKILVVDDNEQLSSMLKDVLESWGYTALTATEGRSCLEIARQEQPDIILLDIMLPGLSGYEVCSELKRDGRTHSIAVIMMTALEDLESRIHGYKVGADNFLVKPINYNEVKAIIQKLLKEKLYEDTLEESCNVAKAFRRARRTGKKDKPDGGAGHFPDGRTVYGSLASAGAAIFKCAGGQ